MPAVTPGGTTTPSARAEAGSSRNVIRTYSPLDEIPGEQPSPVAADEFKSGQKAGPRRPQSKIGPRPRVRLISKKPSVPATSRTPSQSFPAASPLGAGVTTGPKNAVPSTEMT